MRTLGALLCVAWGLLIGHTGSLRWFSAALRSLEGFILPVGKEIGVRVGKGPM